MTEDRPSFLGGASPSEWIEKAREDLDVAEYQAWRTPAKNHDTVAFHCQQSVEKLMKAALVSHGVAPPKIHDLPELLTRLNEAGLEWTWPSDELRQVTVAAVHSRYPGYSIPPQEAADNLRITREIWASLLPLV